MARHKVEITGVNMRIAEDSSYEGNWFTDAIASIKTLVAEMAEAFPGRILITPSQRPYVSCRKPPKEPIFSFLRKILTKYLQIKFKKQ